MDLTRYYELQNPADDLRLGEAQFDDPLALAPPPACPAPLHLATPPACPAPPSLTTPLDHFLDGAPPQTAVGSDQHLEEVFKERSEVIARPTHSARKTGGGA